MESELGISLESIYHADVDAIQKASTILNAIPKDDLKKSFDNLLDRANRCIQCEGDYFEGDQSNVCKRKPIFCFFYKVLELLNSFLYKGFFNSDSKRRHIFCRSFDISLQQGFPFHDGKMHESATSSNY